MANKINYIDFFHNILTNEEYTQIEEMVRIFKHEQNEELEVSFRGINFPNYLRIVEHYINLVDENKINTVDSLDVAIMLADGNTYRVSFLDKELIDKFIQQFTQTKMPNIQQYLLGLEPDNNIEIIFKNRGSASRIFIEDVNLGFKVTQEIPVTKKSEKPILSGMEKILYRYKQRVSFDFNQNIRIDATEVRETGNLNNLSKSHSHYEMEMEVVNRKISFDRFLAEIYSILLVVQDTNVPVGKKEIDFVIQSYQKLLGLKNVTHLESRNVVSLENYHIVTYIPNKYAVTDKADGDRYFLFSITTGVYLLSMNLSVKKINIIISDKTYHDMILDGELIKNEKGLMYLAFDIIYAQHIDYRHNNKYILQVRLNALNDVIDKCFNGLIPFNDYTQTHSNLELDSIRKYYITELKQYWKKFTTSLTKNNGLFISRKLYFIPYGIESCEVFMYADMLWKLYVYDKLTPYTLDGIIYTPINSPYMINTNFDNLDASPLEYKWKKPSQNSIDFFIKYIRDTIGNEAIFYDNDVKKGSGNAYKICQLFVGIQRGYQEKPIPFKINGIEQQANIYLTEDEARDNQGRVIDDGTVVEFIYDTTQTDVDNSYKWIPLRTRYDKTESVLKYGKRYGNNLNIANRIWRTIVNPITEDNIASLGNVDTYQQEIERLSKNIKTPIKQPSVYYQKTRTSQVEASAIGMRAFNNWIKSNMILTYCKYKKSVLDIGCGRGGDLMKFILVGVEEYVGLDVDNNGLYTINGSAYNRYRKFKKSMQNVPPMYFINVDARGLFDVASQESIIPNMSKSNKNLIETYLSGKKKYNIINCQFSIHYYLSDDISWSNFCTNINNHLDDNGYFLITCFDGKLIHDKLIGKKRMVVSYTDDKGNKTSFFEINKIYNDTDKNKIGLAIDFYNSLISNPGTYIREYLVFPDFLVKSLKENCNLELVETDTFFNLFNLYTNYFTREHVLDFMISDTSSKRYYEIKDFYLMLNPVHQASFPAERVEINLASFKLFMLNRYYIFKKTTPINLSEPARIVGINHNINMGKLLMPYFYANKIYIDPAKKTSSINNIYHSIRKKYRNIRPHTYLIRHSIPEEEIDDNTYRYNKFRLAKLKEGSDPKILLIYKSPEKFFYPIHYINKSGKNDLLDSPKIIDDLNILMALSDKFNNK